MKHSANKNKFSLKEVLYDQAFNHRFVYISETCHHKHSQIGKL